MIRKKLLTSLRLILKHFCSDKGKIMKDRTTMHEEEKISLPIEKARVGNYGPQKNMLLKIVSYTDVFIISMNICL